MVVCCVFIEAHNSAQFCGAFDKSSLVSSRKSKYQQQPRFNSGFCFVGFEWKMSWFTQTHKKLEVKSLGFWNSYCRKACYDNCAVYFTSYPFCFYLYFRNASHFTSFTCKPNFLLAAFPGDCLINYFVSHPGSQDRVHEELDAARKAGVLSSPPKFRDMKDHLPHLRACLQESQRLHPVVGMTLMSFVPEGGCELEGIFLPTGVSLRRQRS